MKKINALLFTLFAGAAIVSAQNPVQKQYPHLDNSDAQVKPGSRTERLFQLSNKTTGTEELWISYINSMNDYQTNQGNSPTFTRSGNFLFPDSLPIAPFGGGTAPTTYGPPWVHGLAIILDPKSQVILTPNGDQVLSSYKVDSMAMNMIYVRNHTDTSIVDTLVINVMTNDKGSATTSNFPTFSFSGATASNYGVSKLSFMDVLFDTTSVINNGKYDTIPALIPSALSRQGDMITIKYPLTAKDSSFADPVTGTSFIKSIGWAVGLDVNASKKGKVVGAFVTFKPGFSYKMGDSLSDINYVRFFSREENDGGYQTYFANDWNMCSILPADVRYGKSPGNWNGLTIPSFAYTAPYRFEYHEIFWKLTAVTGISKVEDKEGNVLNNVYPNPSNGDDMVTVPFSLSKASQVTMNLYDAQGRLVKMITSAKFNEGNNQVQLSTSELNSGLYFIHLDVNGSTLTKSVSIVK